MWTIINGWKQCLKCYFEHKVDVSPHTKNPPGTPWAAPHILQYTNRFFFFMLPVIILKCLVPQQQVPEAIARWKRRHLRIHLGHLESWDIQNNARVAAVVLLQSLSGGPAGWEVEQHRLINVSAFALLCSESRSHYNGNILAQFKLSDKIFRLRLLGYMVNIRKLLNSPLLGRRSNVIRNL